LQLVMFELRHKIEYPGLPIQSLTFVEEGMASMTTTFRDGSQVEVGMFGVDSVTGASALMGAKVGLNPIYTQIPGHGYVCSVEDARREFKKGGEFQSLVLQYVQAQLVQSMQSTGCNAKHSIEQRLARWLLMCSDRVHSESYKISHEFLADMIGSTRPTVSLAAARLKKMGIVRYSRGTLHILDLVGLEREACECYGIVREYLGNKAAFERGVPVK
jgi:CRP-like cAMP-binding protein